MKKAKELRMDNPFKGQRIEFHILQSFPVTCLNRDDQGAPKVAVVGGVTRARVSSQCWKRSVRESMRELGMPMGVRTKHLDQLVAQTLIDAGVDVEKAEKAGGELASFFSNNTLLFINTSLPKKLADVAKAHNFELKQVKKSKNNNKDKVEYEFKPEVKKAIRAAVMYKGDFKLDGLDIALFGRMVATATELNVDAACAFAHAISTHKVQNDIDYFTAIDDLGSPQDEEASEHQGASHISQNEFNSASYYRYINLDLGQLWDNLMAYVEVKTEERSNYIAGMKQAIEGFVKALFVAVPSARQNTMAGSCGWDYAKVLVRKGQPLQLSFEKPVPQTYEGGFLAPSIQRLEETLATKSRMAGSLFGQQLEVTLSSEGDVSIDDLIASLGQHIEQQ